MLKNTFWLNIRPNLGSSICDRDKLIFSAEGGSQSDCVEV